MQTTFPNATTNGVKPGDGPASEFLTFRLGAESYGIEILSLEVAGRLQYAR